MAEQYVRINGKTFLYKQKAPFVASGVSVSAAIEYDPEEDRLRCHECGDWFENLGSHVFWAHGISARDYKIRHRLKFGSALVNEKGRIVRSRTLTETISADPEEFRKRTFKARNLARSRKDWSKRHDEQRNERGLCPAQLPKRIRELAIKLGRTPSSTDLSKAGISPKSACFALNVKTVSAVVSLAGLVPNEVGGHCSKVILIERLRDFYVAHGRLPNMRTDHRRGLLPSKEVFRRAFGGMKEAYRAAGLGLVAAAGGK